MSPADLNQQADQILARFLPEGATEAQKDMVLLRMAIEIADLQEQLRRNQRATWPIPHWKGGPIRLWE